MEPMMTLYFAYGSNLNLSQMARRAPGAVPLDKLYLPNAQLVFRGVADVIFKEGSTAPGGVWRLTPECELALDRYEGWRPSNDGMYRKEYVEVDGLPDGETCVMIYVMNSTGIYPPSKFYFDGIREGYRDFGLKVGPLKDALKRSYDDKHPSHVERKRTRRMGRPMLKPDPRQRVSAANGASLPAARAWEPVSVATAADRAKTREAARAADRASAALKGPEWVDRVAKRSRLNTLSEWLEDRRNGGSRY
jgi:hypothetical protein